MINMQNVVKTHLKKKLIDELSDAQIEKLKDEKPFTYDWCTPKSKTNFYYYGLEFCHYFEKAVRNNTGIRIENNVTNATNATNATFGHINPKYLYYDKCSSEIKHMEHAAKKAYRSILHYYHDECVKKEHKPVGQFFVLYAAFVLMIGCLFKYLGEQYHIPVPYTVTLLIMGFLLEAIHTAMDEPNDAFGHLHEGFRHLSKIDPHMILILFIPGLVFESAFNTNYHIFIKEKEQALMLAFPGVILNTLLTGGAMHYFNDYNWYWSLSFMFGSIVSATDPVAVVALLKELGASKRLSTLIEAESLLNDGTAFVMFVLLADYASSLEASPWIIITSFFRLAVGGFLFGIASGYLLYRGLSQLFNDFEVEITLTLCGCYMAFYVGEEVFVVSGVLTVVFMGLYTSKNRQAISPAVEESLHHFWEMIGFVANTILFFVTGQVVAFKILKTNTIRPVDYVYLLVVYIVIHASRALAVWQMFPVLKNIGYGCTFEDSVVMVYGGLRGAIGLALGLIVEAEDNFPQEAKDQILFHVCGIVTLTLCVNATTIKYVVAYLGLDKPGIDTIALFSNATKDLLHSVHHHISEMKVDPHYKGTNWIKVGELQPKYQDLVRKIFGQNGVDRLKKHENARKKGLNKDNEEEEEHVVDVIQKYDEEDRKFVQRQEIEKRVIQVMKSNYWHQFEHGIISADAVNILVEAADLGIDKHNLTEQIMLLQKFFNIPKYILWSYKSKFKFLRTTAESLLFSSLGFAIEVASGFIYASEQAQKYVNLMNENGACDEDVIKPILKELGSVSHWIKEKSDRIEKVWPDVHEAIKTQHATQALLHHQKHYIKHLYHKGHLDEVEYNKVIALCETSLNKLFHTSFHDFLSNCNDESILLGSPLFSKLTQNEKKQVISEISGKSIQVKKKGEFIFDHFDKAKGIFIITRGQIDVIEVIDKTNSIRIRSDTWGNLNTKRKGLPVDTKTRGEPFDIFTLLQETRYRHRFVVKSDHVSGYFLSSDLLALLKESNSEFWDTLWAYSAVEVIKYYFADEPMFQKLDLSGIEKQVFKAPIVFFDGTDDDHAQIRVSSGIGLLLNGTVTHISNKENNVTAPAVLKSSTECYLALNDCVVVYLDVNKKIKIPKTLRKKFLTDSPDNDDEDSLLSDSSIDSFTKSNGPPDTFISHSIPKSNGKKSHINNRHLDLECYPEDLPKNFDIDKYNLKEAFEIIKNLTEKHDLFEENERFRIHSTRLNSLANSNIKNKNDEHKEFEFDDNEESQNKSGHNSRNVSPRPSLKNKSKWARPSALNLIPFSRQRTKKSLQKMKQRYHEKDNNNSNNNKPPNRTPNLFTTSSRYKLFLDEVEEKINEDVENEKRNSILNGNNNKKRKKNNNIDSDYDDDDEDDPDETDLYNNNMYNRNDGWAKTEREDLDLTTINMTKVTSKNDGGSTASQINNLIDQIPIEDDSDNQLSHHE